MSTVSPGPPSASPTTILEDSEVASRLLLLTELQDALNGLGVRCVLARRHRLVLRFNNPPPLLPSGPTSPTLHIFTPGRTRVITVNGTAWRLDDGPEFPATNPAAAAAMIHRSLNAPARS